MQREKKEYLGEDRKDYYKAKDFEVDGDTRKESARRTCGYIRSRDVRIALSAYERASVLYEKVGDNADAIKIMGREIGLMEREGMNRGSEYTDLKKKMIELIGKRSNRNLVSRATSAIAVISLIASIFFLSFDITGNVIGSQINLGWIGIVLFFIGLVFGIVAFRKK